MDAQLNKRLHRLLKCRSFPRVTIENVRYVGQWIFLVSYKVPVFCVSAHDQYLFCVCLDGSTMSLNIEQMPFLPEVVDIGEWPTVFHDIHMIIDKFLCCECKKAHPLMDAYELSPYYAQCNDCFDKEKIDDIRALETGIDYENEIL